MKKEIAIVCENSSETLVFIHAGNTIANADGAQIDIVDNPISDKNKYDSVIFIFSGEASDCSPLLNSWVGHQHIATVSGTDIEQKLKAFAAVLRHAAGIPVPVEIERKYLIKYPPIEQMANMPNCCAVDITQAYLDIPGANVRLRKRGTEPDCIYIKTEKSKISHMSRIELESTITAEEYAELMKHRHNDMAAIEKTRYCLMYDGKYFEIDVFPFWSDKAYLEAELITEDEKVELPPFIEVIKEVTEDKRYTNKSLAKLLASNQINTL
ncbi:MAG: hypothetical protein IJ365_04345 [Clostridia bacterium]|nr:hypothetical protein [Clostridia bacterium]